MAHEFPRLDFRDFKEFLQGGGFEKGPVPMTGCPFSTFLTGGTMRSGKVTTTVQITWR
jgi:hypothetical protein